MIDNRVTAFTLSPCWRFLVPYIVTYVCQLITQTIGATALLSLVQLAKSVIVGVLIGPVERAGLRFLPITAFAIAFSIACCPELTSRRYVGERLDMAVLTLAACQPDTWALLLFLSLALLCSSKAGPGGTCAKFVWVALATWTLVVSNADAMSLSHSSPLPGNIAL